MQNTNNRKIISISTHIAIWLIFILTPVLMFYFQNPIEFKRFNFFLHLLNTFFQISFFYINYHVFVPKLLLKKKFFKFLFSIILSISFVLIVIFLLQNIFHLKTSPPGAPKAGFMLMMFFSTLAIGLISLGIRLVNEWFINEKQKEILEKEKVLSELAFLKSQLNPHFIFNVLNNICSLSRKKSDDTETAIIKLSHLMRYNLYTSEEKFVDFEKEIQYLNDYIDIQKMRLSKETKINLKTEGNLSNVKVEPLLFIPFVENAFKHGIISQNRTDIEIFFKIIENKIIFKISNMFENKVENFNNESGIGLKNVQRRLNILYPEKHILKVKNENNIFIVDLIIETND